MMAILHAELVYFTATAALLALTLTRNRLIARVAPAHRCPQKSAVRTSGSRRPTL
jgi:hypothetical protein